jgi:hypothetical protein
VLYIYSLQLCTSAQVWEAMTACCIRLLPCKDGGQVSDSPFITADETPLFICQVWRIRIQLNCP